MLTPEQSRAARGLLDWSQTELAKRSNLSESTIRDFEKGRRTPSPNNLAAIARAFVAAGVSFIDDAGTSENGGFGVRLSSPSARAGIERDILELKDSIRFREFIIESDEKRIQIEKNQTIVDGIRSDISRYKDEVIRIRAKIEDLEKKINDIDDGSDIFT